MGMEMIAMRPEDAWIWRPVSQRLAGIAERSGFYVKPIDRCWHVRATPGQLADLQTQIDE